jgi:hypothetical protein
MAALRIARTVAGMRLTRLFAVVLAFDALGLVVTLATGADDLGHALAIGTPINAPLPFVAVQALFALAAVRYRAAAAVLAVLCLVSVVSGASDGSYAADLATGERTIQVGIVAATAALGALAARTAIRPRPRALAVASSS